MSLKKSGEWWRGSTAADLELYLLRHVLGRHCRGVDHRVAHACCTNCAGGQFALFIDGGGRIVRVCAECETEHKMCDLDQQCDADSAGEIVCTCMFAECETAVGFALMDPSSEGAEGPVGHLYVAGRCTECGLCGVYGEWSPQGDFCFSEMEKNV